MSPHVVVVKNSINNNTLQFDPDVLKQRELDQILRAVARAPVFRQQTLVDELLGQARVRKMAIRNFGTWANSVVARDQSSGWTGEHFYADQEADLRAVRAAARARESLSTPVESVSMGSMGCPIVGTKPSPEIKARLDAIRSEHQKKQQTHVS